MTAVSLISELMSRPDAVKLVQQAQNQLQAEEQKRRKFYEDITDEEKAEFINGEIVIHSPVKKWHSVASFNVAMLLNTYRQVHEKEAFVGHEKIMIRLTRNDYEPDVCYFGTEKAQHFRPDQVLFPAPDLVVEVLSESTKKNDRTLKFTDYQSHEISEYWIVDAEN